MFLKFQTFKWNMSIARVYNEAMFCQVSTENIKFARPKFPTKRCFVKLLISKSSLDSEKSRWLMLSCLLKLWIKPYKSIQISFDLFHCAKLSFIATYGTTLIQCRTIDTRCCRGCSERPTTRTRPRRRRSPRSSAARPTPAAHRAKTMSVHDEMVHICLQDWRMWLRRRQDRIWQYLK